MKSKNRFTSLFRSKPGLNYSEGVGETELLELARSLGRELSPGSRVLLEGVMGAGKSTFARGILEGLKIPRESEGSPTFPIAHEYATPSGVRVIHADLYRLDGIESELEATGLMEALWDTSLIVITEWLELFPSVTEKLIHAHDLDVHRLEFGLVSTDRLKRTVGIKPLV